MKKYAVAAMVAAMVAILAGCNSKGVVTPLVSASYTVVNDTVGYLHTVDNAAIVSSIDALVGGAGALNTAITLVAKYYPSQEYIQKALVDSQKVLDALKAVQADPSQVAEKVAIVTDTLKQVRGYLEQINTTLGLGIVFPEPKVLSDNADLNSAIQALENAIQKAK